MKKAKTIVFIPVLAAALWLPGDIRAAEVPANGLPPGDYTRSLRHDGRLRTYLVHVPRSYDGRLPWPVVLAFHGGGSNARQFRRFTGLNETADQNDFIAIYPNGTGKTVRGHEIFGWNGGPRQPGGTNSEVSKVDDVGFTKALLDDLASVVRVDAKRVYATGMSMGAIMVYRLASELSTRIAAIAPVAGPMGTDSCHPQRPVSVIDFHGTGDDAVPLKGGKGGLDVSGTDFFSVEHSIRAWVNANGCNQTATIEELPDTVEDGTRVTRKIYSGGKAGAEVVLYVIEGGGHTWPGREFGPELKALGKSTRDVSANDLIWEFFRKHPIP